jgi:hypothetical protein
LAKKIKLGEDIIEELQMDLFYRHLTYQQVYTSILKHWKYHEGENATLGTLISILRDGIFDATAGKNNLFAHYMKMLYAKMQKYYRRLITYKFILYFRGNRTRV